MYRNKYMHRFFMMHIDAKMSASARFLCKSLNPLNPLNRPHRGFCVVPNSPPAPSICVATLVPCVNGMGRIPHFDPLSVAFCCHDDDDDDNDNDGNFDGFGSFGQDIIYRALASRDAQNEAKRVVTQMEGYIGKRDCLQVITLREHKRDTCDHVFNESGQNSIAIWRSRYGITHVKKSVKPRAVHVHAIKPVSASSSSSVDMPKHMKVLSYEMIQRALQRKHGRYWINHAIVYQDIPGLRACDSRWVEQTLPRIG